MDDTSQWRHAIVDVEGFARVFDYHPLRAVPLFSILLGPSELGEMLREAGAPEPWKDPLATALVGRIDNAYPIEPTHPEKEVWTAIRTLRRFLPEIIREYSELIQDLPSQLPPKFSGLAPMATDRLARLARLQSAVREIGRDEPNAIKRKGAHWHFDALELLWVYQKIVDPECGTSADGPAVRFIQAGLLRLSAHKHEADAIEAALRSASR